MANSLKSLSQLFNRRIYRIPDYQRGYAWQDDELEAFWDDLQRLSGDRSHYTGQITLEVVKPSRWGKWGEEERWLLKDSWDVFYIVDGQQRLTTSIILLKAILDRLPGKKALGTESRDELLGRYMFRRQKVLACPIFGYEKDNPSHEFFRAQILGIKSNRGIETETKYTANLLAAYEFFRDELARMKPREIQEIFQRLTNRFRFNEYELEEDFDVFVAFETMNNRGKDLSKLELLKNRLIYLSTLLPVDKAQQEQLRANITDSWKTVYEYLGKEKESPLDDDKFLRAHWILYFDYSRAGAGEFHSFLLNQEFTTKSVANGTATLESIQDYVTSLQEAVKAWWKIHFPSKANDLPAKVRKGLERLQRLGYGAFEPLFMAALLKGAANDPITELVSEAERFIFAAARFCAVRGDTGNSHFYRMAGEMYRDGLSVQDALGSVRSWTSRHFDVTRALVEINDRFTDGQGFYDWRELRYFLFEHEQHLKANAHSNTSKLNWDDLNQSKRDHVTVEHIFPQRPKAGDWPEFEKLAPEQQHRLRHSLGNLLPLSRPKNSELSNSSFKKKKRGDNGRGYAKGSFSEAEIANEMTWTPRHVMERGLRMLEFFEERWDVSLGDHETKLRLVGLEFMARKGKRA